MPVLKVALAGPPLSPVTVWAALSLFVHVTVEPFLTVTVAGLKAKLEILTLTRLGVGVGVFVAFGVAVAVGVAVGNEVGAAVSDGVAVYSSLVSGEAGLRTVR